MLKSLQKYWLEIVLGGGFLTVSYFLYRHLKFMKVTDNGLKFFRIEEGFENKAYRDKYGNWTTGIGHLIKKGEEYLITKVLTDQEVIDLFHKDISIFEAAVNGSIQVSITQPQFDALVSMAFNIGEHAFRNSNLVKSINGNGSRAQIVAGFSNWFSHGDLTNRRAKECKLFLTGDYSFNEGLLTKAELSEYFINPAA